MIAADLARRAASIASTARAGWHAAQALVRSLSPAPGPTTVPVPRPAGLVLGREREA